MNEDEILKNIPKKAKRSSNTVKFGMFGLSLGKETYDRLQAYCDKHNIAKATLVRSLVVNYLDNVKSKENINV
jgi:predicted DNA-binding protein